MKIRDIDRHKPILTALKKAGFKAVEIEEQDKKTVISVSPAEKSVLAKADTTAPCANL